MNPMVQVLRNTWTIRFTKPRNPMVQVLRNTWTMGFTETKESYCPSIVQYLNHRIHWNQGILWSKYCAILGPMVRILRNTWTIGLTTTKESAHRKGRPAIKLDGRSPVGLCPAMAFSVKKPKSPMVQVLRNTRTIGFIGFNKSYGPSRAPYSTMIALLGFNKSYGPSIAQYSDHRIHWFQ